MIDQTSEYKKVPLSCQIEDSFVEAHLSWQAACKYELLRSRALRVVLYTNSCRPRIGRWLSWGDTVHSSINSTALCTRVNRTIFIVHQVPGISLLNIFFCNGFQFCWPVTFSTRVSGVPTYYI